MAEDSQVFQPHPPPGKKVSRGRKNAKASDSKHSASKNWLGSLPGNPRTAWMGTNSKKLPLNTGATPARRPSSSMGSTKRSTSVASHHAARPSSAVDQRSRRSSTAMSNTLPIEKEKKKTYIELKDPVEMRDDMLELKKTINALREERKVLKHNLQRMDVELKKKDKKLEDILTGKPSVGPGRDSLRESSLVSILKLRVKDLEKFIFEKDQEMKSIKNECNYTRMVELEVEQETYLDEIQRLQKILEGEDGKGGSNSYMAEKNKALFRENKELREDLAHTVDELYDLKQKSGIAPVQSNFSINSTDSKKISDLEQNIAVLREKLLNVEKSKEELVVEYCAKIEKLALSNDDLAEKLVEMTSKSNMSSKQVSVSTQSIDIEASKEAETAQKSLDMESRMDSMTSVMKSSVENIPSEDEGEITMPKKSVGKKKKKTKKKKGSKSAKEKEVQQVASKDEENENADGKEREESKRRASITIQKSWRQKQARGELDRRKKQKETDETATMIQSAIRGHNARQRKQADNELEESVVSVQASMKGHLARTKRQEEEREKETEEASLVIQSAFRGHLKRNPKDLDSLSMKSSVSKQSEKGNSSWSKVDNNSLFGSSGSANDAPQAVLDDEFGVNTSRLRDNESVSSMDYDAVSRQGGDSVISGEFEEAKSSAKTASFKPPLDEESSISSIGDEKEDIADVSLSASSVSSELDFSDDDGNLSLAGLDDEF